ncbi:hypothetical protein VFPYRCLA_033 [Candidatus Vidania fulgoroideae]|nr:hypothetical protein VFPYRCLA_033 [Candidatus Vidania fulgoroideae]
MIKIVNISNKNLVKFKKEKVIKFLKKKMVNFENLSFKNSRFFLSLNDEDFKILKKKFKKDVHFLKKCTNISLIGKRLNSSSNYIDIFLFLVKNKMEIVDFFSTEYKVFFSIRKKKIMKLVDFIRKTYKI